MENKKRAGFIAPVITEDHHIFGGTNAIPLPVIKVDGDWTKYLPTFESQLETTFDSDGCTVYGTLNAIETLEDYLNNKEVNYSDRFVYNAVGITPPGSDPHVVATTIRGQGLVYENDLTSVVGSLAEFMTPRPIPVDLRIKGVQWLNKRMLGHQWLWTGKPDPTTRLNLLKEALTKGTVCASVTAWYQNAEGLYYSPPGLQNEHWTEIYNIDETGIYVFDSYNDAKTNTNLKKLTLDHDIQFAKVYFETIPTQQQNWLMQIIISILQTIGILKKNQTVISIPPPIVQAPVVESKYNWSASDLARHSVRVICDEEGLNLEQKNTMDATIGGESGWDIHAKRLNYAFKDSGKKDANGKPILIKYLASTDTGICQWNDYYHGKEITPDEAENNPEKAVRLMCAYWKRGQRDTWIAWKDGSYKKHL